MAGTFTASVSASAESLRTNYARIGYAAQEVLPKLLKEILTNKQPQSRLHSDVSKNQFLVKTLRAAEWSMINAARTHGFDNFDITLIYKLVRNLNLVPAPTQGWDFRNDPTPSEITLGDDIERMRRTRNKILHRGNAKVSDTEMATYFLLFKEIARRLEQCLGKPKDDLVKSITDLECCSMDANTERMYLERLEHLRTKEEDLSKEIKSIHQRVDLFKEYVETVQECVKKDVYKVQENVKKELDKVQEGVNKVQENVDKVHKDVDCLVYPDSMKAVLNDWREENKYFVRTPAVDIIFETLQKNHIFCVAGNSGIGKSATIHHIALYLQDSKGYQIRACYHPSEISDYYRKEKPQVFVFDDVCGKYTLLQSDVNQWIKRTDSLTSIIRSNNIRILATCRSQVFREPQFKRIKLLTDKYCDLSSDTFSLTNDIKLKIARQYLPQDVVKSIKEDINNYEFLPLMFALYKTMSQTSSVDDARAFFKNPFDRYTDEMNELRDAEVKTKFCALFFVLKNSGCINASLFTEEESTEDRNARKNIFEACGIARGTPRIVIKEQLDSLLNFFLKTNQTCMGYIPIHDKMFDFLCFYFGTHLQVPFIKYVDSKILHQRTQLRSIAKPAEKFTVLIKEENEKLYFEKTVNDLSLGRGFEVFCSPGFDNKEFMLKLIEYIKQLDDDMVKRVIFSTDDFEKSTLFWACITGKIELVKIFLQKGPNVDSENDDLYGNLLLNFTIHFRCELIHLLLEKGANVNKINKSGHSTLTVFLNKIDNGIETFQRADFEIKTDIFKQLVSKGANVNAVYYGTYEKKTPLITACQIGDISLIKLLIEKGADVNPDDDGLYHTPLTATFNINQHNIVTDCRNQKEIIKLLLDKGANINAINKSGNTLLTLACRKGDISLIKLLIENGADVNPDNDDIIYTPLTAVSHRNTGYIVTDLHNQKEIINLLLDEGANVNAHDKKGDTPLTVACRNNDINLLDFLITKEADVSYNNENAIISCLKANVVPGQCQIIELLSVKGKNSNHLRKSEKLPLTTSCESCNIRIVELLLQKRANVNTIDINGDSLLTLVCQSKSNVSVIENKANSFPHPRAVFKRRRNTNSVERYVDSLQTAVYHTEGNISVTEDKLNPLHSGFLQNPLTVRCSSSYVLFHTSCIINLLLDKGASINHRNTNGRSPLTIACDIGNIQLARFLIKRGADVNPDNCDIDQTLLTSASESDSFEECFKIRKAENRNIIVRYGHSPLTIACKRRYLNLVRLLIENGADVNHVDSDGHSHLTRACQRSDLGLVMLLIEKGADLNPDNKDFHQTLLITACNIDDYDEYKDDKERFKIVEILLTKGVNINIVDRDGQSPLTIACKQGAIKLVSLLIETGADVNPDNEGLRHTPLTAACINYCDDIDYGYDYYNDGHFKVLNFLLEKGSTINAVNRDGQSPLTIACKKGNFKLTRLLIEKGADVNPDNEGLRQTPLTAACKDYHDYNDGDYEFYDYNGHSKVVEILSKKGATVNTIDEEGNSPFSLAYNSCNVKLIIFLKDNGAIVTSEYTALENMFLIENNVKSVDNLSLNQLKVFQNLLEREVRSKSW